jgi:membrane-associated phospholipid phosphatase
MSAPAAIGEASGYLLQLFALIRRSATQLVRPPSHSRRMQARLRLARRALLITAGGAALIVALMWGFDAREIGLMPPRGTPSLWPVRILTDFGKDGYVLALLAAMLLAVAIIAPALGAGAQVRLLDFGNRLQFVFFAVLVPLLAGELIKWIVGRGRPFVGGKEGALYFEPFAGTEAYASFPSAHAITAFALAFAVAAVWPRARVAIMVYAVLIGVTRLLLLAHHPSDVVAGALIGVTGAMAVQYWFAARRLVFVIDRDGTILPAARPSPRYRTRHRKGVAGGPSAP